MKTEQEIKIEAERMWRVIKKMTESVIQQHTDYQHGYLLALRWVLGVEDEKQ